MLGRFEDQTLCTDAWRNLHHEYGLGRLVDNKILHWTRDDLKHWKKLIEANRQAHEAARSGADRTGIAQHTANEKLTTISVQNQRLFCHAINAPLYLTNGEQPVRPDIEYRAHYQIIDINRYSACIIIENLESFVYCQRFNWPNLPATLVLYRGHDKSTQALQALLDRRNESVEIYIFPDIDPAGLSISMGTKEVSHIITPDVRELDSKGLLRERFAIQLQRLPNLQSQAVNFSEPFQTLVSDVLQTGTAVSQEWLCAHEVPLKLIPMRK